MPPHPRAQPVGKAPGSAQGRRSALVCGRLPWTCAVAEVAAVCWWENGQCWTGRQSLNPLPVPPKSLRVALHPLTLRPE